jgi:hypothetical protein
MNALDIIIIIVTAMPVIATAYIAWDLISHKHTKKFAEMSYDKIIDEINHESMPNTGYRLSQNEILENTRYIVDNCKDFIK